MVLAIPFTMWYDSTSKTIAGGFFTRESIQSLDDAIADIISGRISYINVRDDLITHTHEELTCGSDSSDGQSIMYAPGLSKSCMYNKPGVNPDYKLTYKLRDYLTTTYIRSLDDLSAKRKINAREHAILLTYTFNKCLEIFMREYIQWIRPLDTSHIKILYKGGNVIAVYTRYLYDKLNAVTRGRFERLKNLLNRGDWDYSLYIEDDDPVLNARIRTFVLFMLQEIKKYLDANEVFNVSLVANRLKDIFVDADAVSILNEYRTATKKSIVIESVKMPNFTVTSNGIVPSANKVVKSQYSMNRNISTTDSYEVDSFIGNEILPQSQISIGFIAGLKFSKTYLTSDFDLARVKINNIFDFNIDGAKRSKTLSADIIDMSFINPGDTKSTNIHKKIGILGLSEFTMRRVDKYEIPWLTPHYLFYDLCNMIIEEGVYPWDDKKYQKRIDRLMTMGILSSMIAGNIKIAQLIKKIRELRGKSTEESYEIMSGYSKLDNIIEFSIPTDHFTYEILKSIYKSLMFNRYSWHLREGVAVPANISAFMQTYLSFIFDKTSEIKLASLAIPINEEEYTRYINNIWNKISMFEDIRLDKINVSDFDNLDIGSL